MWEHEKRNIVDIYSIIKIATEKLIKSLHVLLISEKEVRKGDQEMRKYANFSFY